MRSFWQLCDKLYQLGLPSPPKALPPPDCCPRFLSLNLFVGFPSPSLLRRRTHLVFISCKLPFPSPIRVSPPAKIPLPWSDKIFSRFGSSFPLPSYSSLCAPPVIRSQFRTSLILAANLSHSLGIIRCPSYFSFSFSHRSSGLCALPSRKQISVKVSPPEYPSPSHFEYRSFLF